MPTTVSHHLRLTPRGIHQSLTISDLIFKERKFVFIDQVLPSVHNSISRNQGKGMLEVPWLAVELREWFASHRLTFPCSSIIILIFPYLLSFLLFVSSYVYLIFISLSLFFFYYLLSSVSYSNRLLFTYQLFMISLGLWTNTFPKRNESPNG